MSENRKIALVLGGGGARGAYEIGVWQALREMDVKIDIITGTSVGAINGALVAQDEFDLACKVWKEIQTHMVVDKGLLRKKNSPLKNLLSRYIDETRVRSSETDFGLVTVELPGLVPRYFFTEDIPKGKLIDYIVASASLFPAFKIADIDNTKYVDGGYLDNLPVGMALKKGATHVVAVDLSTIGLVQKKPLEQTENLIIVHCKWDLGDIMVFDGKNSAKNIRLGYLDTLKAFGFFDGSYYAFAKGEMNKRSMKSAETAARVFELDPQTLYTKDSFRRKLTEAVLSYQKETEAEVQSFQDRMKKHFLDKELLLSLLKKINQKSLTLVIADYLKANPDAPDSLLAKPVSLLFKDESRAANYLVKEGIL
ncbi:MAG: patatin-like phospholipase family protein [Anaerovoracaceae bacterium]|jgi:NTE family protein